MNAKTLIESAKAMAIAKVRREREEKVFQIWLATIASGEEMPIKNCFEQLDYFERKVSEYLDSEP